MSMEQEMNQIYREIAETVNNMIPEDWKRFCFYAQISDSGGGTYFFYNTPEDERSFKYSLEIPFEFKVDKEQYKKLDRRLFELGDKLRNVFKENHQELWYSFTITLDNDGKFKMHYDYTNWLDTNYSFDDQLVIWEYKYLGNEPEDNDSRELINKYQEEYPENPI